MSSRHSRSVSATSLLSDVFTNLGYAHGKAATAIISVFTVKGPQAEILQRIGQAYRGDDPSDELLVGLGVEGRDSAAR